MEAWTSEPHGQSEKLHGFTPLYSWLYFYLGYTLITFILAKILLSVDVCNFLCKPSCFQDILSSVCALWYYELLSVIWKVVLWAAHIVMLCNLRSFQCFSFFSPRWSVLTNYSCQILQGEMCPVCWDSEKLSSYYICCLPQCNRLSQAGVGWPGKLTKLCHRG